MTKRIIRAKAPLRIGIAGGGTDVDPYASEKGGLVFNTTIDKYAYCSIVPNDTKMVTVTSPDYGTSEFALELPMKYDGNEDLIKAAVNYFAIDQGFKAYVKSDVPPGSGLGGSSTLMVAIIKAFAQWKGVRMSKDELAALAYHLEREEVGLKGGKQDQYAAAFGGFNMMSFTKDGVKVRPVKMKDSFVKELQERSILCFSGKSRDSADIIESQVKKLEKSHSSDAAYDETKRLAMCIGNAMKVEDLDGAAALLNIAWREKKKFSSKIASPKINELYDAAMENGAIGGKVSGAGGGGFMYFICAPGKRDDVINALVERGAKIMPFKFESKGAVSGNVAMTSYTERVMSVIDKVQYKTTKTDN